jgi:threonine dehydrogenase-like Zn-dependent dehydrogenase
MANAGVIAVTDDHAPDSWRRLVGQMLRAFATPGAPLSHRCSVQSRASAMARAAHFRGHPAGVHRVAEHVAPVQRFLPELIDLIWNRHINPGKVFDLELQLDQAADAYRSMDQRQAIKVLLRP